MNIKNTLFLSLALLSPVGFVKAMEPYQAEYESFFRESGAPIQGWPRVEKQTYANGVIKYENPSAGVWVTYDKKTNGYSGSLTHEYRESGKYESATAEMREQSQDELKRLYNHLERKYNEQSR